MSTCQTAVEPTTADISDEELARFFSQGNEWAFNELMARYGRKILNYINRMIYDRDRAEDLLQETFVRVFRNIDRFGDDPIDHGTDPAIILRMDRNRFLREAQGLQAFRFQGFEVHHRLQPPHGLAPQGVGLRMPADIRSPCGGQEAL